MRRLCLTEIKWYNYSPYSVLSGTAITPFPVFSNAFCLASRTFSDACLNLVALFYSTLLLIFQLPLCGASSWRSLWRIVSELVASTNSRNAQTIGGTSQACYCSSSSGQEGENLRHLVNVFHNFDWLVNGIWTSTTFGHFGKLNDSIWITWFNSSRSRCHSPAFGCGVIYIISPYFIYLFYGTPQYGFTQSSGLHSSIFGISVFNWSTPPANLQSHLFSPLFSGSEAIYIALITWNRSNFFCRLAGAPGGIS